MHIEGIINHKGFNRLVKLCKDRHIRYIRDDKTLRFLALWVLEFVAEKTVIDNA